MDNEFKAYRDELNSRKHFTFLTKEEEDKYYQMALAPKVFSLEKAKMHPFTWAYHVIGIKPRDYQFKMLDYMFRYGRVASVTSRQIGKSTCVGLFAFWAAYNNIYPSGPEKKTKIVIVSHTEQAAKELLRTIDGFITMADDRISMYTRDRPDHQNKYFRDRIKMSNQFEIHFARGTVKVYPPTKKIRGNSADILIIDEAAWLHNEDPDYFFASDALPTVTATAGKVFLFSTPKTTNGFFHDIICPHEEHPLVGWNRLWMPWTIVQSEEVLNTIWNNRLSYLAKGDELDFKIEYEADFLSGKFTYFNPDIIDAAIDPSLREEFSWKSPVTMGLDFGDTHSRTVLTVIHHDGETVKLLWYKEFPGGYNNADIADYIYELFSRGRFKPDKIVVDDCVGGKTAIELLKRKGFHLDLFQFTKSKNEFYEYLKVAFASGKIKLYNSPTIVAQLKSLESHELPSGKVQIRKPNGGRDDIADSLMLACSPYIQPKNQGSWRFANFKGVHRKPRVQVIK